MILPHWDGFLTIVEPSQPSSSDVPTNVCKLAESIGAGWAPIAAEAMWPHDILLLACKRVW